MHNFIILLRLIGTLAGYHHFALAHETLGDPIITDPSITVLFDECLKTRPLDFPDSIIVIGILRVDTTTADTLWCEQNRCYRKFFATWGGRRIFATERQPGIFHPRTIIVAGYWMEYTPAKEARWRLVVAN